MQQASSFEMTGEMAGSSAAAIPADNMASMDSTDDMATSPGGGGAVATGYRVEDPWDEVSSKPPGSAVMSDLSRCAAVERRCDRIRRGAATTTAATFSRVRHVRNTAPARPIPLQARLLSLSFPSFVDPGNQLENSWNVVL